MKRRPPQLDAPIVRRRMLMAHEIELWRSVMEKSPLQRHVPELVVKQSVEPEIKPVKKPKPAPVPSKLDAPSRAKIHKGKRAIDATIDLHGFTVDVAHRALIKFVSKQQSALPRVVLVITGKGRAPQSGILRAQLPHWLEISPLREQVSGFSPAGAPHGGEGAWYITIRKLPEAKR